MNMLLLFLSLNVSSAAEPPLRANCEVESSGEALLTLVGDIEYSFSQADLPKLQEAGAALEVSLPCVSDELLRPHAARVHRGLGLVAWVAQDKARARVEFAAARLIEPAYVFPDSIVPVGHPIASDYLQLTVNADEQVAIGAPKKGRIQLDGQLAVHRSAAFPVIVQLFDSEGAVWFTADLAAEQPLPLYEAHALGKLPSAYSGSGDVRTDQLLGLGAGATAIASVALMGAAYVQRARWADPSTPFDAMAQHRSLANGYSRVGSSLGLLTVGLGAGAVFTHSW